MDRISEAQRRACFITKYGTEDKKLLSLNKKFPANLKPLISRPLSAMSRTGNAADNVDVVFSYAPEDRKYAAFLKAIIKEAAPSLTVKTTVESENKRLSLMDSARCVVAFLTPNYLDSPEQVEEFHIALCRQRTNPATVLFPIAIHHLPQKPAYFHLVSCPVSITDTLWSELSNKWHVEVPSYYGHGNTLEVDLPPDVTLGLHEAGAILMKEMMEGISERSEDQGDGPFSRPVLHNILKIQRDAVKDSSPATVVDIQEVLAILEVKSNNTSAGPALSAEATTEHLCTESSVEQIIRQKGSDTTEESSSQACIKALEDTDEGTPNANKKSGDELNPKSNDDHTTMQDLNDGHKSKDESEDGVTKANTKDSGYEEHEDCSDIKESLQMNESDKENNGEVERGQRRPKSAACQLI